MQYLTKLPPLAAWDKVLIEINILGDQVAATADWYGGNNYYDDYGADGYFWLCWRPYKKKKWCVQGFNNLKASLVRLKESYFVWTYLFYLYIAGQVWLKIELNI